MSLLFFINYVKGKEDNIEDLREKDIKSESKNDKEWWGNLRHPYYYTDVVNREMTADPTGHFQILMSDFPKMKGTSGFRCMECERVGNKGKCQTRYACLQCSFKNIPFPHFYPVCQSRSYNSVCWNSHTAIVV